MITLYFFITFYDLGLDHVYDINLLDDQTLL